MSKRYLVKVMMVDHDTAAEFDTDALPTVGSDDQTLVVKYRTDDGHNAYQAWPLRRVDTWAVFNMTPE